MSQAEKAEDKPLFRDFTAEDDDLEVTQVESLCMACHKQGMTKLLLTKIPFFREVVVASFTCDHCGEQNTELQQVGRIQDKGILITVKIKDDKDLSRQVVQTSFAKLSIPRVQLEIPPNKGALTTVEGIIDKVVEGLQQDQTERKVQQPEVASKIDDFILKLIRLKMASDPFEIVIDDPSGNSFVENPYAPKPDPETTIKHYERTKEQNRMLGLVADNDDGEGKEEATPSTQRSEQDGKAIAVTEGEGQSKVKDTDEGGEKLAKAMEQLNTGKQSFTAKDEVLSFPTNCPGCSAPINTYMKMVDIPHFKEVIIMATTCDKCGFRDNEVKAGAGIEPKGKRIKLKITDPTDLTRDVLKSETAGLAIPELDFETEAGSLGGKFTTLEGILTNIKDQLMNNNPFSYGDSSTSDTKARLSSFCDQIQQVIDGRLLNVHFVLDDPAGNSFIQNFYAPEEDPEMEITFYERNFDQNETLGLNDIKTENY